MRSTDYTKKDLLEAICDKCTERRRAELGFPDEETCDCCVATILAADICEKAGIA